MSRKRRATTELLESLAKESTAETPAEAQEQVAEPTVEQAPARKPIWQPLPEKYDNTGLPEMPRRHFPVAPEEPAVEDEDPKPISGGEVERLPEEPAAEETTTDTYLAPQVETPAEEPTVAAESAPPIEESPVPQSRQKGRKRLKAASRGDTYLRNRRFDARRRTW